MRTSRCEPCIGFLTLDGPFTGYKSRELDRLVRQLTYRGVSGSGYPWHETSPEFVMWARVVHLSSVGR